VTGAAQTTCAGSAMSCTDWNKANAKLPAIVQPTARSDAVIPLVIGFLVMAFWTTPRPGG